MERSSSSAIRGVFSALGSSRTTGAACATHNTNVCASCEANYELVGNSCSKCYNWSNGVADRATNYMENGQCKTQPSCSKGEGINVAEGFGRSRLRSSSARRRPADK